MELKKHEVFVSKVLKCGTKKHEVFVSKVLKCGTKKT